MSSGMFRGKESSNRIELSGLVQDLLNFGVLGSLRLWGVVGGWLWVGGGWKVGEWVDGGVGWLGVPHTHAHARACTQVHACTHMHVFVNMIISYKWLPPLGESLGIPYNVICACIHALACVCMCTCMGGTLSPPPTHIHPPPHPPGGVPPESIKIQ